MRILVIGSGGREHAIVRALACTSDAEIFCAPGNAGIAEHAVCIPTETTNIRELVLFAQEAQVKLTIVGPEAPLVNGVTDYFQARSLLVCGPRRMAARAEGSKVWFKQFLGRHNIPTPPFMVFNSKTSALAYIRTRGAGNIVIKANGLMGGKGVILPENLGEARHCLERLMVIGSPGETVVIEDRLYGVERSVMAITDGTTVYMLPFTQDYKREADGDRGRNTGGMGAHTLTLSAREGNQLSQITQNVISALATEGCPYASFIYLGFIMTENGPMVLECNCRLGDPEAQVILPSISGNFAELCMATAQGNLVSIPAPVQVRHALCVVLASGTYPSSSDADNRIFGLGLASDTGALVFHGRTAKRRGGITTNRSGRVLSVVGTGETLSDARIIAYDAVRKIHITDKNHRRDIGKGMV